MSDEKHGFVAYPSQQGIVRDTITAAVALSLKEKLKLLPWELVSSIGLKLDDVIREKIVGCDVLLADITHPNFNVYYELGYAVAIEKPIIPLVNTSIQDATKTAQATGLFDTTSWLTYTNSNELNDRLKSWNNISWTGQLRKPKDHGQPLFILDTLAKIDFRNHIINTVINKSVRFRSFDPSENPRLTAAQAVADISSSAGIIIPLLGRDIVDNQLNNLRAAFLAGLCHGFELDPLIIQYDGSPAPLDYRDYITNSNTRRETEGHVADYCADVLIRNQQSSGRAQRFNLGLLNKIDLGASAAENETQQLADYFVSTSEYSRALRAESAVVSGRKGSGKSAIAFRVAAELSHKRFTLLVDLRPAAHNLTELRETLLGVVGVGLFDHTVAAFWQYIIYLELILAVRDAALKEAKRDFDLQERLAKMETKLGLTEALVATDFTSRLEMAVQDLMQALEEQPTAGEVRSELTNRVYEKVIPKLRDELLAFSDFFDELILLIDDLDKGWPPRRLEQHDVRMLRHLIDSLKKIQRDVRRKEVSFRFLLFLRSDVYENLVEQTADRGKDNVIKVDWTDRAQLEHMLRERVTTAFDDDETGEQAWDAFNPLLAGGSKAVDQLITNSLYRPRFLIEVAERVLSFAVNRGHTFVTEDDVEQGLSQMSLYLVSDFGYEMRDVAGTPEDIFYAFIGKSDLLTHAEVTGIVSQKWPDVDCGEVIELLMWYGFLGLVGEDSESIFIFDRAYDFRRLLAERADDLDDILYSVNPAFLRGLSPQN